jgi:hypothetical protein
VPGCTRSIKPALILENLVGKDGNRSGNALGLSRAWMVQRRGVQSLGGLLGSRSSAQFVRRRYILPRLLLAAAAADSCATLLHPAFSRDLSWTPGLLGVALSVAMCVDYKCSETVGSSTAKQCSTVQYRQIGGRIVLAHKKQKRWSRMQIKLFVDCPRFLACLLASRLPACLLAGAKLSRLFPLALSAPHCPGVQHRGGRSLHRAV